MKAILQCMILGGILALAACGKDNGSSAAAAPVAVVTPNGCTADQIPTQAGCGVVAPQCGPNMGLVGSTCYPAVANQNCPVPVAGQPLPYNQGYNGYNGYNNNGLNTGCNGAAYGGAYGQQYGANFNRGYAYGSTSGTYVAPVYNTGSSVMYYNQTTQQFVPNYYDQTYVPAYGYRPYRQNGVTVSGGVTLNF